MKHTGHRVTPNEIARSLGITGLQFRNWLRAKNAAGHPLLAGHVKHQRYEFSRAEADELMAHYTAERSRTATPARRRRAHPRDPAPPSAAVAKPAGRDRPDPGHQVEVDWMGDRVTTLDDLLRDGLRAVVVGINPAPTSVAAGHYWQGNTGRTLWRRLRMVGLLPNQFDGYEDDAAFAAGVGFTDVVKRPTARASELTAEELTHGRSVLEEKLAAVEGPLVIFVFKKAATTTLSGFRGNGFLPDLRLGRSEVFIMPGPYESTDTAKVTLSELRERVAKLRRIRN